MKTEHLFNSLQFRFALMAIVVSAIVLSAATYSFVNLNTARDKATINLERRQQLLQSIISINSHLDATYRSLHLFLLDPYKQSKRENVFFNLGNAIEYCNVILLNKVLLSDLEQKEFSDVQDKMISLKEDINKLIMVRSDPQRQFPSMSIGSTIMQPNRNRANNSFLIIFNELNTDNAIKENPQVYKTLIELRNIWTQMLSNFRLYLANRVGSFNVTSLNTQEVGIATHFSEFTKKLDDAIAFDDKGLLGFETSSALLDLRDATTKWYQGFQAGSKINRSNEWRMDSVIIQTTISPAFDEITHTLGQIETRIDLSLEADIKSISSIAHQSAWILLAMSVFAIAFVIVLVLLTQSFVFRPILTVSRAMKSQALGKQGHTLPISKTTETRGLIDAFNEMYRLVNLRQSELEYRAMHDSLTSLPNRALLFEHIEHDIQLANRSNQEISLMVIDLDRFKEVNDTLGHHIGDKFLIEVGARFSSVLRETDTVARLGGDEFSILIPNMGKNNAASMAGKIIDVMKEPIHIGEYELPCSASIGISTYPTDGDNAQTLLQHADIAMYIAKRNQSGFEFYDAKQDQYSIKRLELVNDLRTAIKNKDLELAFQPIINLDEHSLCCVEALLRWTHPSHGYVSPELIIDIAEQTGLITPLTYMVIEKALHQQDKWEQSGLPLAVSVNLSMHNLRDKQLVERIKQYMDKYNSSQNRLILEITESAMMSNPHQVIDILDKLETMNVKIAIDDFGTGFSSLAYLKKLPVHLLKIDRSFIVELEHDQNDQAIVHATLGLAHELGLKVIAEGVETHDSQILLAKIGCDAIQGYYISEPLNASDMEKWINKKFPEKNVLSQN